MKGAIGLTHSSTNSATVWSVNLSPIFFDPATSDRFTDQTVALFVLEWVNPIAPFIVAIRDVIYGGSVPEASVLAYVAAASAIMLLGGRALFRRMQGELAVVV